MIGGYIKLYFNGVNKNGPVSVEKGTYNYIVYGGIVKQVIITGVDIGLSFPVCSMSFNSSSVYIQLSPVTTSGYKIVIGSNDKASLNLNNPPSNNSLSENESDNTSEV